MADTTFTCPRCFHTFETRSDANFCPHCGLRDVTRASVDTQPMDVTVRDRTFRVFDRVGIGAVCMLYRCRFEDESQQVEGLFKIARDPHTNDLVANEAAILRQLHVAIGADRFGAFLPKVVESFAFGDGSAEAPRWANVLRMHKGIESPDELYTLAEVRSYFPNGLDPRDVAWIWRRLLNVIGFVHAQDVVHAAVLPVHVMIEPREHKLLLIDFCGAIRDASRNHQPPALVDGGYKNWYEHAVMTNAAPGRGLDVSFAARCMIELLAGDPITATFSPDVDRAVARYFQRCAALDARGKADAWGLMEEFDRLIEILWGPRTFRVLELPPKSKGR